MRRNATRRTQVVGVVGVLGVLGPITLLAGCDPPGEVDNPRQFRVMAQRESPKGKVDPYIDLDATFSCLGWSHLCDEGDSEPGPFGNVGPESRRDHATDGADPEVCECEGGYVLSGSRGLVLTFSGDRALAKGEEATTDNGMLEATLNGQPGFGWVIISNSERLFTDLSEDYWFVDVAGGFELDFVGVSLRRGLFFSIEPEESDGQ